MARGGKRPGAGRKYGSQTRDQSNVALFARSVLEDTVYQKHLRERANTGQLAPAVESMLWHYAYGKPAEQRALDEQVFTQSLLAVVLKHVGSAEARQEIRAVIEAYTSPTALRVVA